MNIHVKLLSYFHVKNVLKKYKLILLEEDLQFEKSECQGWLFSQAH